MKITDNRDRKTVRFDEVYCGVFFEHPKCNHVCVKICAKEYFNFNTGFAEDDLGDYEECVILDAELVIR